MVGKSDSKCRVCGCTNWDSSGCIKATGQPCYWVRDDLCSACAPARLELVEALAKAMLFATGRQSADAENKLRALLGA
jgi:hypothetical protein